MEHAGPITPAVAVPVRETQAHDAIDRSYHAALGSLTGGLSPMGLATAWFDWAAHLAGSPAKQAELHERAVANAAKAVQAAVSCRDGDRTKKKKGPRGVRGQGGGCQAGTGGCA